MRITQSPEEVIRGINWELLVKQKAHLLDILGDKTRGITEDEHESLVGILHLIDCIQDSAYDFLDIPQDVVFGTRNEDSEENL